MPGWLSNGVQPIGAPIQNGVTVAPKTLNFNGVANSASNATLPTVPAQVPSESELSIDTQTGGGAQPQTAAAFAAQIAMIACAMTKNAQTSTVHAATSNTFSGMITTEALTTAAGAVYTFTLTNSLIAAVTNLATPVYANILFDIRSGTNTVPGMQPTSSTAAAGSTTLTFTNYGAAALNGTMVIAWHLVA